MMKVAKAKAGASVAANGGYKKAPKKMAAGGYMAVKGSEPAMMSKGGMVKKAKAGASVPASKGKK